MLALAGTRDISKRKSYGEIEKIYMEKNHNVRATNKLLQTCVEQGDLLVLQGMNETEMKRPDKTNLRDHTWTKGNTYVDIEALSQEEALDAIKSNTVIDRIAKLTKDKHGRQVGQVVTREEMIDIKHEMKTNPKEIQFYPEQDFEDTIGKAITRAIFHILNTRI